MAKQRKSGSKSKNRKGAKRGGKLPKSYIKKFGGLKAAWKAFKSGKKLPKKAKKAKKAKKSHAKKPKAKKNKAKKHMAREAKKPAKRPKTKKSSGKAKKRKQPDVKAQIERNRAALANIQSRYEAKLQAEKAKLAKAEGAEKARIIRRLENLIKERDAELDRIRKQQERSMWRERDLQAAEKKRKGGKKRKKARRKNPVEGWGEHAATAGGVVLGGLLLVLGDALISNRGNLQNTGGVLTDQPAANGGVYLLEAQNLPVWKQFKRAGGYRIAWALANTGLPIWGAAMANKHGHKKLSAFLAAWGYTDVGISAVKLSTDGIAQLFGTKAMAMKLVPAQLVALNATAAARASNLPLAAAPIATGTSGKLGYATTGTQSVLGAGAPGCEHVGAGQSCCSSCASGGAAPGRTQGGNVPQAYPPGNSIPGPGGAPPQAQQPGGFVPPQQNPIPGANRGTTPGGLSVTGAPVGAQGAKGAGADNVVSIKHPAFANRAPQRKSFTRKYG